MRRRQISTATAAGIRAGWISAARETTRVYHTDRKRIGPLRAVLKEMWEVDLDRLSQLAADGDGTFLVLRHLGLPNDGPCPFHNFGWEMTLGRLLVVAEGGDPGPNPFTNL